MVFETIVPVCAECLKDPITQHVVKPIGKTISYAFKCDGRIRALEEEITQLKNMRHPKEELVAVATNSAQEINKVVSDWLKITEAAIRDAEALVQRKEDGNSKCFAGLCPNFKARYQLSKDAVLKSGEIRNLRLIDGLDPISFPPDLEQIVQDSAISLSSRVLILDQIMAALREPNLNMIGVYGMGGLGKTKLAEEVLTQARQEKLFETVVLVAVSQTPELRRIQGEIADFLSLKFDAEEIPGRASQLHKRLEDSKVLIILDDLWKELDLAAVGIPSSNGCKVMLTSRNMHLLSQDMRAQKLFQLEALREAEALDLFMSIAEPEGPNLHSVAKEIAERCGGLPLLIKIAATKLKNKELRLWNDTLRQLSTFGREDIHEKLCAVLRSSYDDLGETMLKPFFLLCSKLGQSNIRVQHLLIYSMGLGILQGIRTIEEARNSILSSIDELKARCLLLDGDMAGCVKMHDAIRDVAIEIASSEEHAFIGTSEVGLRDWPRKRCTQVSLPFCGVSELPLGMGCPEAVLFLLFSEDLCLHIPDRFFDGNIELRVVDFTGLRMVPLPSSLGLLANLQTLCLHKCRLDTVALVGELKQLELLSFAGSNIIELPREIRSLTQLKLLDVRDCSNLQLLPSGILSELCSLEELYMLNSFVHWDSKENASLAELDNLLRLVTLEIEIPDPKIIPTGFNCFSQLKTYKISIGNVWGWASGKYETSKTLKLKVERGFHLEDGTELLLKNSEDLYLDGVRGTESIFDEGFPQLKHMHIENDHETQYLLQSATQAFAILESLYLEKLQSLEKICCGRLGVRSFGHLQILKISQCKQLTSLFAFSSGKCLQQLRELEIDSCDNLEAVFVGEGIEEVNYDNEHIEFTQLSSLKLYKLPHFTGFCKLNKESEQFGLLLGDMVSFPNLTSLELRFCASLKQIFTASMAKRTLMQLKKVEVSSCDSVEEIIKSKKMEVIEEEDATIAFPELDSLSLDFLLNLKRFSSFYSIEFPLLSELQIKVCHQIGNFVERDSSSENREEYFFNDMVTFSNLERMEIYGVDNSKYLWDAEFIADHSFRKLKFLHVGYCTNLLAVFPSKLCRRFERVERLSVHNCERVEEIYQPFDFTDMKSPFALQKLRLNVLLSLKQIWNTELEREASFSAFENLQSLDIRKCRELKYVFPSCVRCGLPQLREFNLRECSQMEVVTNCPKLKCSETQQYIPSLEEIKIDEEGFRALSHVSVFSAGWYTKLKKVTLVDFCKETSLNTALKFVIGIKSLEMLVFQNCSLEDIFGLDDQNDCLRVKHLKLREVNKLKQITKKGSQHLQHVRTLHIDSCYHDLLNIAPSSVSLKNLTTLHVQYCDNMRNLVTASTAKTMEQLTEMKVVSCQRIEEIVGKDGDGTENDAITFKKLKVLELSGLSNFNSFCSHNCTFSFPLLEQVSIKKCPRMNIFCGGTISTPRLRWILFEDEQHWEGTLNDTISSQLRFWVAEQLEEGRRFRYLESLVLVNNTVSSRAISANQMEFLNKLRNIVMRDCDSIQVVFDLDGHTQLLPSKLEKVELRNLPVLTQLCNRAPTGILDFSRLKELRLVKCSRLVYAFTWSMATCLSKLRTVELEDCEMMETLIVDDEDVETRAIFSSMFNVDLKNMPKFSSIYSGRGELECPSLKSITIMECPNIKAFISTHTKFSHRVLPHPQTTLSVDMKSIRGLIRFEESTNIFSNLKSLEVYHFSGATKSGVPLVHFLSRLPSLENLDVHDSTFVELLNSNIVGAPTLPPITYLDLRNLVGSSKTQSDASLFRSLPLWSASFQNVSMLSVDDKD